MPELSIITPVFNGERYINETINSVLSVTTDSAFEYLVIDDGSTDSTPSIIARYADRLSIITQANGGEAAAVNSGLKSANGRYILILSADDPLLTGELLTAAIEILDKNSSLVAVYPDWQIIDSLGEVKRIITTREYSLEEMLGKSICIPGPGTVFRRVEAIAIGGRDAQFRFVSDYDFWLRLSSRGGFRRIDSVLAQWREHPESTSIKARGLEMARERIQVIEDFLASHPQSDKLSRSARSWAYYNAALLAYFDRRVPGRTWIHKAILIAGGWMSGWKMKIVLYLLIYPFSFYALNLVRASASVFKRGQE